MWRGGASRTRPRSRAGDRPTNTIASYAGWPALFSAEAMMIAVGVSAAVGLFFGFYPAWKASRLDPIVALGRE